MGPALIPAGSDRVPPSASKDSAIGVVPG